MKISFQFPRYVWGILALVLSSCCQSIELETSANKYDMDFIGLSTSWDEAVPLGNATLGTLIWQKDNNLRLSIDRIDLWDLRPVMEFEDENFSFKWVCEQVEKKDYAPVERLLEAPYSNCAGPSKIPGGGLEFPLNERDSVKRVHLYQRQAVCEINWSSGKRMKSFIHATEPVGWFVFDGVDENFNPSLVPPMYNAEAIRSSNDHSEHSLFQLGYPQGKVTEVGPGKLLYTQPCGDNHSYSIALKWRHDGDRLVGVWSVTSSLGKDNASDIVDKAFSRGISEYYSSHLRWWNDFYGQSSICIPDKVIEKQYYNELYKMGCIARENSYPISLQSVWTADNGQLPPWKGDYHHDLNTTLSYWPFYCGNHLKEGLGYLNTLWEQREENKAYTKRFWGVEGLNVPGQCTLQGKPLGGWSQYAFGPTISAWLSQHFYLHWKYSQDRIFLKDRAYPYIKDVATYLENITILREGVRTLPLSSSPEFNDNGINAWFRDMTNFDCALIHFAFGAASELASELGYKEEALHWSRLESELPEYSFDTDGGLCIAKDTPYRVSHRHFSHLLAIHPLGLLDKSKGSEEAGIIDASLATLDKYGPDYWVGYSYSWLANLKARALDGDGAAEALRIFAECFCLRNGFHANGDQSGTGKSLFTYRPFTLEGNMAFASGMQEMLLQSHNGMITVFPAIPSDWKDVSFDRLRSIGAFVISASMRDGRLSTIKILAEKGGRLRIKLPSGCRMACEENGRSFTQFIDLDTSEGETLHFNTL